MSWLGDGTTRAIALRKDSPHGATVTAPAGAAAATSAMPPDSGVAITVVPQASASSATFGRPSQREDTSIASGPGVKAPGCRVEACETDSVGCAQRL